MRKLFLPILAMLSVFMLAACGDAGNTPKKTVDNFMNAYKTLDFEEAEKYISAKLVDEYKNAAQEEGLAQEEMTLEELEKIDGFKEVLANLENLTKQLKHNVTDTKIDDDTAEITVNLTYADASEPFLTSLSEMVGQIFALAFSGQEMTEEEMETKTIEMLFGTLSKNLGDFKAETKTSSGVITLVKEEDKWVITDLDESTLNALTFNIVEGMEEFDPFGFGGMEFEEDFNDFEIELTEEEVQ